MYSADVKMYKIKQSFHVVRCVQALNINKFIPFCIYTHLPHGCYCGYIPMFKHAETNKALCSIDDLVPTISYIYNVHNMLELRTSFEKKKLFILIYFKNNNPSIMKKVVNDKNLASSFRVVKIRQALDTSKICTGR